MKRMLILIVLVGLRGIALAMPGSDYFRQHFHLIPEPQKIVLQTGGGLAPSSLKGVFAKDATALPVMSGAITNLSLAKKAGAGILQFLLVTDQSVPASAEAYVMEIKPGGVVIRARTIAGLFYGAQTLSQLMEDATAQQISIPSCTITDYPDIAYRAIHLDMKHHVESGRTYYDIIDGLAKVKINAIIVEFEDKLRYRKAAAVGSPNAISIEEFRAISKYAKARNIEISPLVQGLGHASFILKHEEYKKLRDDSTSDWAFDALNPQTYDVQFALYEDAIEATPDGRYLHVGGDEVGKLGVSELARKSGLTPIQLQMQWLKKVCDFAQAHHRIPIFWDDMLFKLSGLYETTWNPDIGKKYTDSLWATNAAKLDENVPLFPANCVYMRWNYDAPDIPGNHHAIDWYQSHHLAVMAATAAQEMWPMMPRAQSNFQPIKDFCRISAAKKMEGILCTAWDDSSPHFETFWRGFYDFGFFSWHFVDVPVQPMNNLFRQRFYGAAAKDSSFEFQDQLEKALDFWETAFIEKGYRHNYPGAMPLIDLPNSAEPGKWSARYKERLEQAKLELNRSKLIRDRIEKTAAVAQRNFYNLEVMAQINKIQSYSCQLLLALELFDNAPFASTGEAKRIVLDLVKDFSETRRQFENVYATTRMLYNPNGYLLDQNQHHHLANATMGPEWMYVFELAMNDKILAWRP